MENFIVFYLKNMNGRNSCRITSAVHQVIRTTEQLIKTCHLSVGQCSWIGCAHPDIDDLEYPPLTGRGTRASIPTGACASSTVLGLTGPHLSVYVRFSATLVHTLKTLYQSSTEKSWSSSGHQGGFSL